MTDLLKAISKAHSVNFWYTQATEMSRSNPKYRDRLQDYHQQLEESQYGNGICPFCYVERRQRGNLRQAPELNSENDGKVDYFLCKDCGSEFKSCA
jgi:hypothetical protein